MRFSKKSLNAQGLIEFVLILAVIGLVWCAVWCAVSYNDSANKAVNELESEKVQFEHTKTGTVKGKYIGSGGYGKHYFVTVKNGKYKADHEVSLAEYNAAKAGDSFPVELDMTSDSVKETESTEEEDNRDAAAEEARCREEEMRRRRERRRERERRRRAQNAYNRSLMKNITND